MYPAAMKTEFSEILLPGHRVLASPHAVPSSSNNTGSLKWFAILAAMFIVTITGLISFYEVRFAKYDARLSVLESELGGIRKDFDDFRAIEQQYVTEFETLDDEDDDGGLDDDDDDDDGNDEEDLDDLDDDQLKLTYGEVKLEEGGRGKERLKRQIPPPPTPILDPNVPRTADGVPILDDSYLDRIGAPTSSYIHWSNILSTTQDSEGLRLYESLVATGGRGEPRSPDYYPETTASSGILPHHRTSAAWVERPQRSGGLQLKSGDSDDDLYSRGTGSRSSLSSSNSNVYRHASSSVSGAPDNNDPNRGVTASSYYRSSTGTSGNSNSYLSGSRAGGNTVINRASRVPATGDILYPQQNARTRAIQYPPLKRIGQGDGEVVARVLQADTESEADSARPNSRVLTDANLGDTAGAHAESRRSSRKSALRRGPGHRRHQGSAKYQQRRTQEDPEAGDSDEINIVKAEAWTEGPKAVAAHYVADVSNYTTQHRHYEGNGRLRNVNGIFAAWMPSEWMAGNEASKLAFSLSPTGILTIKQTGLYYVYAQIHYIDEHDINSFTVNVNSDPFLQCTTMTETYNSGSKSNTCFTAGVTLLNENDRLFVRDVEANRFSIFKPEKSFFGLMKLNGDSGVPKV